MDLAPALDRTFSHAHGVIAGIRPDQFDDPTPCEDWTVRDLLEHVIGVVAGMGAAAAGRSPNGGFELSDDPGAQFGEVSTAAIEAWRQPGVMEQVIEGGAGAMPGQAYASINLLDTATHTWDLARASGQPAELPDDVAEAALAASHQIVSAELRPGRFGPEIAVPDDSDATARLVAFLGRTP